MLRRELLATLRACYVFIQRSYARPANIWKAVRRELRWMRDSLIFVEHDLSMPWSGETFSFDASPWGCGVVRAHADVGLVQATGQFNERWRFKRGETMSLRRLSQRAIVQQVFTEKGSVAARQVQESINKGRIPQDVLDEIDLNVDSFIPLVPRVNNAYLGTNWHTCVSAPWRRSEHISVLEVRSCVSAMCLNLHQPATHHKHWLMLSDSVACILSGTKGRSSKPGMCRGLRQLTACLLCCSIKLHLRWIPSELNVTDGPSRRGLRHGWQAPSGGVSARPPRAGHAGPTRSSLGVGGAAGVTPAASAPRGEPRRSSSVCQRAQASSARGAAAEKPRPGIRAGLRRSGARRRGFVKSWRQRAAGHGDESSPVGHDDLGDGVGGLGISALSDRGVRRDGVAEPQMVGVDPRPAEAGGHSKPASGQ